MNYKYFSQYDKLMIVQEDGTYYIQINVMFDSVNYAFFIQKTKMHHAFNSCLVI